MNLAQCPVCKVIYVLVDGLFPEHWPDKSHKIGAPTCPTSGEPPVLDRNTLIIKTHGYVQNEREKLLAFEREDAMRVKLEEALAANKEMGDQLERLADALALNGVPVKDLIDHAIDRHKDCGTFQCRLVKAHDGEDMPI